MPGLPGALACALRPEVLKYYMFSSLPQGLLLIACDYRTSQAPWVETKQSKAASLVSVTLQIGPLAFLDGSGAVAPNYGLSNY